MKESELKSRLTRYRQIRISVIGRKSGKTISIPVWFVLEGEKLYLLPVQGCDTQWYRNVLKNPSIRIDARGAEAEFQAAPITDDKAVKSVVEKFQRDTESSRQVPAASTLQLPKSFDSIAVLPLINASGDPETEYLSDGISESIINLLSRLPNLRVIPRTTAFRYKSREADLKTLGRDLNVRTLLTGKVIQRGDRLIVQTELVDVVNDAQLWGGQFNRKLEDIFDVQKELARQISENLRLRLVGLAILRRSLGQALLTVLAPC